MVKGKSGIVVMVVLAILGTAVLTGAAATQVSQVVYITMSKACGCSAQPVQDVGRGGGPVFPGPRQALLKRIDYDTDREAAVPYIGEYHLIRLPALLFLDAQHLMLWRAVGEVAKEEVAAKSPNSAADTLDKEKVIMKKLQVLGPGLPQMHGIGQTDREAAKALAGIMKWKR